MYTRHIQVHVVTFLFALFIARPHIAASEQPECYLGPLLSKGTEAAFYAHPTDPSLGIRLLFNGADLDTVGLEVRKFQFLQPFGGPVSHGPLALPDGRYGHLMERIPGTRNTVVPNASMSYEDWREGVQLINRLSREGIVLRDLQFIRDGSTGRLRPIDIDPIRTSPTRAAEFYTVYKECWRNRVQKMTPADISRHQARARAYVAARESARNLGHLGEQAAHIPSRSPTINPKALISVAELPLALALPYIERGVTEDYYRQEHYQFSTVVSQLGDRIDSDELEWIKSELESIREMKQSALLGLWEQVTWGQASLLEQQAGSLGNLREKIESKHPDMQWQRSWSQWFWGYPKRYLPLP